VIDVLLYASIPVLSALVGWGTNVLALKMTFYPLEFVGIRPYLGWQGIIPSKGLKMAENTVELMTTKLVGVEEVFARLETPRIVEEMNAVVADLLRRIIDAVMQDHAPRLWKHTAAAIKERIYEQATAEAPTVISDAFEDIREHVTELIDLKALAIDALVRDKRLLNRIFLEVGDQEFRFIERSGWIFGGLFGLAQMLIWLFYQGTWLLPTAGFIVGYATNALALKMIFEPLRPKSLGPFRWQGLFLRRQHEVAEAYARLVAGHVVSTRNLLRAVSRGPTADRLIEIVDRHIQDAAARYGGPTEPVFRLVVGSQRYNTIKTMVTERMLEAFPYAPIDALHDYADEAMAIEGTLRERLGALEPEAFVGLLRPIFQEDEYKLILVGAVLGLLVGLFQALVVFGS